MPPTDQDGLQWNPPAVKEFMQRNGFDNREQLSKDAGESRSAIFATFDETWSGTVSYRVIELLAKHYGADFGPLIKRVRPVRKTGHSARKPGRMGSNKMSTKREKPTGHDTP